MKIQKGKNLLEMAERVIKERKEREEAIANAVEQMGAKIIEMPCNQKQP